MLTNCFSKVISVQKFMEKLLCSLLFFSPVLTLLLNFKSEFHNHVHNSIPRLHPILSPTLESEKQSKLYFSFNLSISTSHNIWDLVLVVFWIFGSGRGLFCGSSPFFSSASQRGQLGPHQHFSSFSGSSLGEDMLMSLFLFFMAR